MSDDIIDNGSFLITKEHGAIPLLGHELKYRVSNNEVLYETLVQFCQAQDLNVALIPKPRVGGLAFALATNILKQQSRQTVEAEDWDGNVTQETWSVRTLKKCNEYVLIRERIGMRNGKRDLEQTKMYRMVYVEGDNDISAEEWCRRFMLRTQGITQQQVGETSEGEPIYEPVEEALDSTLRRRVRLLPYDEDEGLQESEDIVNSKLNAMRNRFVALCKCVDEVLMRAKLKNLLNRHNAIQDPTVKGGVVQILNQKKAEELEEGRVQPHLETLGPFAKLLRFWGNTNRPDPTAEDAVWSDEKGRVDYRSKGNMRLTPVVETDTVLDEMAQNYEYHFNQQIGELFEKLRNFVISLNEVELETGAEGKDKRKEQIVKQLSAMQDAKEALNARIKEVEEGLDRTLSVRDTPYKDQAEDIDPRLAAIKTVDQDTVDRIMKVMNIKKDNGEGDGFDGLPSLFG